MRNRGNRDLVVSVEDISHIFSSMSPQMRDQDEPVASSVKVRFIPVISTLPQKSFSCFFEQFSFELLKMRIPHLLYDCRAQQAELVQKMSMRSQDVEKQIFKKNSKDQAYPFLNDLLSSRGYVQCVFCPVPLEKLGETLQHKILTEALFVLDVRQPLSDQLLERMNDILMYQEDVQIWLAFSGVDLKADLAHQFAEFNHYVNKNLRYGGLLPAQMSAYQTLMGGKLVRLGKRAGDFEQSLNRLGKVMMSLERAPEFSSFSLFEPFLNQLNS